MKILLTAVNAKYIHSNLAVYNLKAYAEKHFSEKGVERGQEQNGMSGVCNIDIEIAEYTINQPLEQILMDLYRKKPDVLCFSCYLWNITYVDQLVREIHKVLPEMEIWLGGPEVSWNAEDVLLRLPQVRGVIRGEGEETFLELVRFYAGRKDGGASACCEDNEENVSRCLNKIHGITFHSRRLETKIEESREKGIKNIEIVTCSDRPVMKDLNALPFVYHHIEDFEHKIIYYESSRGCPFLCSYCLSSIDKCLRFRDLELVKKELQFFIDHKVPQVKFVDRTFNCRHDHALAIWRYLAEHDQGMTNFHFEVAADLLNEEELELIASMRPGLIQLEIGIQSTNEQTIREIHRTMNFEKAAEIVRRVRQWGNVHQHLDLIAGLPYEDYETFRHSFNDVYALKPEQLQLGFLKVLKGSYMEEKKLDYELLYQDRPPFEVLSTKWLSYEDVICLKGIEEMVEIYYNSGQFEETLELLEREFTDAFSMFEALRDYYEENGLSQVSHTRISRYEILSAFIQQYLKSEHGFINEFADAIDVWQKQYRESLTYDLYLRENVKNRPAFAGEATVDKETAAAFYDREEKERCYLKGYEQYDKRQMRKMTHLERIGGELLLFDYQNRNPLTNQARVCFITVTVHTLRALQ